MMSEKPDALVLSVTLESGHFETKLRIPFPCTLDEGKATFDKWLDFAITGLRIGAQEMDATFEDKRRSEIIEEVAKRWDGLSVMRKMWSGAEVAQTIRNLKDKP